MQSPQNNDKKRKRPYDNKEIQTESQRMEKISQLYERAKSKRQIGKCDSAAALYKQAVGLGDPKSMLKLGWLYFEGSKVKQRDGSWVTHFRIKVSEGEKYFKMALKYDSSKPKALYGLGCIKEKKEKAAKERERKTKSDSTKKTKNKEDAESSFDLYLKAAELNNPRALYKLYEHYLEGGIVEKDISKKDSKKALDYMERAIKQGYHSEMINAYFAYAGENQFRSITPVLVSEQPDPTKAFNYLQELCKKNLKGTTEAWYIYAVTCFYGLQCEKNLTEAFDYFAKFCNYWSEYQCNQEDVKIMIKNSGDYMARLAQYLPWKPEYSPFWPLSENILVSKRRLKGRAAKKMLFEQFFTVLLCSKARNQAKTLTSKNLLCKLIVYTILRELFHCNVKKLDFQDESNIKTFISYTFKK